MALRMTGRLARRTTAAGDHCPIDRTLQVVANRSAFLLLREALYGTSRFDDLVRLTGLSEAVAAKRLKELVEHGLLTRTPYRVEGQRTRHEYVLTERGHDLLPALLALAAWGRKHTAPHTGPVPHHEGCDAGVEVTLCCGAGHPVTEDDLYLAWG